MPPRLRPTRVRAPRRQRECPRDGCGVRTQQLVRHLQVIHNLSKERAKALSATESKGAIDGQGRSPTNRGEDSKKVDCFFPRCNARIVNRHRHILNVHGKSKKAASLLIKDHKYGNKIDNKWFEDDEEESTYSSQKEVYEGLETEMEEQREEEVEEHSEEREEEVEEREEIEVEEHSEEESEDIEVEEHSKEDEAMEVEEHSSSQEYIPSSEAEEESEEEMPHFSRGHLYGKVGKIENRLTDDECRLACRALEKLWTDILYPAIISAREITKSVSLLFRGYFILKFALENGTRPSEAMEMEMRWVRQPIWDKESSQYVYKVMKHKTSSTYGAARITLDEEGKRQFEVYINHVRPRCPGYSSGLSKVFFTSKNRSMNSSTINGAIVAVFNKMKLKPVNLKSIRKWMSSMANPTSAMPSCSAATAAHTAGPVARRASPLLTNPGSPDSLPALDPSAAPWDHPETKHSVRKATLRKEYSEESASTLTDDSVACGSESLFSSQSGHTHDHGSKRVMFTAEEKDAVEMLFASFIEEGISPLLKNIKEALKRNKKLSKILENRSPLQVRDRVRTVISQNKKK